MKNSLRFKVVGMTCGGCVRSIRQLLESMPGVTVDRVAVGMPVDVRVDDPGTDRAAIVAAIERAGFRPVFET